MMVARKMETFGELRAYARGMGYEVKRSANRHMYGERLYVLFDVERGICVGADGYRLRQADLRAILRDIERNSDIPMERRCFPLNSSKGLVKERLDGEEREYFAETFQGDFKPWW